MKIVCSTVLYLFGALFCANLAYSDSRSRIRDGSVSIAEAVDVTGCEVSCMGAWSVWYEEPSPNLGSEYYSSKYHIEARYEDGNGHLLYDVVTTNDFNITVPTAGRLTFKYCGYTSMEVWVDGSAIDYVNLYPGYAYQVMSDAFIWRTYTLDISGYSSHNVKLRMWGYEDKNDIYALFLGIDTVSFKGRWPISYHDTKGMYNSNPVEYTSGNVVTFNDLQSPEGWKFVGWSPSSIKSGASGAQVVTAQWERLQYAVSIDEATADSYAYGQVVTLSTFTEKTVGSTNIVCCGWTGTGDIPSAGVTTQVTFTVTKPSSLHWIYETNYWFEAQASSGGTVSVDKAGYSAQTAGSWVPSGTNVVLVATPDEHWHFTGWTESGTGNQLSSATRQQFVVNNPLGVRANFAVDTYVVTFDLGEHGTKDSGTLSQSVAYGMSAVAPSVKANVGYRFVGWDKTFSSMTANATITAQYEPIGYALTYTDVQGCANSNPKTYTIEDAVTFSPLSGRVGWRFLGWNPSGIALGTTGDKSVQATWAANAYSVSFDANGGTGSMAALPMTYDTESDITSNGFVRTGYVFVGWSTSGNGAVEYQNGVAVSNLTSVHNGTVTLYAIWEQLVVPAPSITPVDGATFSTDSCLVSLDCAMEGVSIYFTTNGATPKTSASYLYTQPFTVYGTVNIKAVAVKDTVKSSYATATITKVDPVPVETPVITPVDGSTFSTETCVVTITCPTDGAAIYYTTDGTTPKTTATYRYTGPFVITGTSTIKAVATKEGWLKSAYGTATISKVSLSLEGVLGVDSRVSVTTGGAADWVPINDVSSKDGGTCARSGLGHGDDEAESWIQLSVNGKGTLSFWCKTSCEHDDDGAFTWDRLEVIVDGVAKDDWRMDGISEWMQRTVVFETQGTHAVKVVYIKDVSDYDGEDCVWIDDVTWSGESAEEPLPPLGNPAIDPADGETFATDTCTVTITCATPNAVIYYSTNGQTPGTTEDCRYTGPFTISKTTTVKAVAVRGEEKSEYITAVITKNEAISYSVAYDANGGNGEMSSTACTYGGVYELPACTFSREGYSFSGWATSAYSGVAYAGGASVSNLTTTAGEVVTLYAVWEYLPITNPIIAPADGAAFDTDDCTVTISCTSVDAVIYYSTNGRTPSIAESSRYTGSFSITKTTTVKAIAVRGEETSAYVTAVITKNAALSYIVAYDANGGAGEMSPTTCQYGTIYTLPSCSFTFDGYSFKGWATVADGAVVYADGAIVSNLTSKANEVVELFAVWRKRIPDGLYSKTVEGIEWTYIVRDGTISLGSGLPSNPAIPISTQGEILIPEMFDGCPVTQIGCYAFYNRQCLTGVIIPSSVTNIGTGAFGDCSGMTSITIPSGVTSIGGSAFIRCGGLKSVTIPSTVTSIGPSAFAQCSVLEDVTMPSSITCIDSDAFYMCRGLTSVKIPPYVNSIGKRAFSCCSGLTNVTISSSVTSIGDSAFSSSGLTCIIIPSSVVNINNGVFSSCGALTRVTIPSTVTNIGQRAFSACGSLSHVEIPASVVNIGDWAFSDCDSLAEVRIPPHVTSIGGHVFSDCSSMTNVVMPSSMTHIDKYAFSGCCGLTQVTIPEGVTNIGEYAFCDCRGLTDVTIPSGVSEISGYVFAKCSGLKRVSIPSTVISVGKYAFSQCSSLVNVKIPLSVTNIAESAFSSSGLSNISLPPSMSSIGDYALSGCECLTNVTIPSSVVGIGKYAFFGCKALPTILIPHGVEGVGDNAFYSCSGLTSVVVPASVTNVGDQAFGWCRGLTNAIFLGSAPVVSSEDNALGVFYCAGDCAVTVYSGMTGWDDDGDGKWQGVPIHYREIKSDLIPYIGDTPTAADVKAAVSGAADPLIATKIDEKNYNDFRDWAGKVKTVGGSDAGAQDVMAAENAWISYALGQGTLLTAAPTDADLSVEAFEPTAEAGKFDFTVSVKDIEVGSTAAKENLKKVFGLEGATILDGTAFSRDKVDIEFGTPVGGKVKFTAGPKDASSGTFFMKVKMLP